MEIAFELNHDGRGFGLSKPTAGMGLKNMQERADLLGGEIEFMTQEMKGTSIRLKIPYSMEQA